MKASITSKSVGPQELGLRQAYSLELHSCTTVKTLHQGPVAVWSSATAVSLIVMFQRLGAGRRRGQVCGYSLNSSVNSDDFSRCPCELTLLQEKQEMRLGQ
ncbi:hypothetical protein WMY93_010672 [Mugilogobius chulae]|uniref:Uncharacterized protein n=1 Tax=Mugilogobius chulae TaxID=88201 RepID=A0AAW0P841_9GOBI